jgi:hypothetical protein
MPCLNLRALSRSLARSLTRSLSLSFFPSLSLSLTGSRSTTRCITPFSEPARYHKQCARLLFGHVVLSFPAQFSCRHGLQPRIRPVRARRIRHRSSSARIPSEPSPKEAIRNQSQRRRPVATLDQRWQWQAMQAEHSSKKARCAENEHTITA